jgi:hypothetical protein
MVNQFLRTSHDTLNRMQSSSTPESSMSSSSASTAVTNASLDQRLIAREPVTSSTMADTNSNNNASNSSSSSSSATPIQSKPHASPLNQPTVIIDDLSDIEVSPQRGTTSSNKNNNNTLYAQPSEQVRHYKLSMLIGFDTTVPIMQSINRTTHLAMASRCLHLPMMMTITVMTTLSTSS